VMCIGKSLFDCPELLCRDDLERLGFHKTSQVFKLDSDQKRLSTQAPLLQVLELMPDRDARSMRISLEVETGTDPTDHFEHTSPFAADHSWMMVIIVLFTVRFRIPRIWTTFRDRG
jgi:hypothetical protein